MPREPLCAGAAGKAMAASSIDLDERALGRRWAAALKARFPGRLAGSLDIKRCAIAFGVSVKTATTWAAGQAPIRQHLLRGLGLFGWSFMAEVVGAALPTQAEVEREVDALRRDLALLDRRLHRLGGESGKGR